MTDDDIESAISKISESDDNQPEGPNPDDKDKGSTDESGDDGLLSGVMPEMSGTGKSLEAYEESPYRSLAAGTSADVDADEMRTKGELHIARGVDGLLGSVVDAGHPVVDLAIGAFLLMLAGEGSGDGGDDAGYDGNELGGQSMDDTPGVETTGDE